MTGDFTGNSISLFPYLLAAKDDQKIYSEDCVPEGFVLSDPDHLKAFDIEALYSHMLGRQKKGLSPFIVLSASPQHVVIQKKKSQTSKKAGSKGKGKMRYVEIDDMMDVDEEDKGKGEKKEEDSEEDREDLEAKVDEEGEEDEVEDEEAKEAQEVAPAKKVKEGSDGEEEMPLAVKIGPPKGKGRKISSSTQDDFQVAGPSKLTPLMESPKKKRRHVDEQEPTAEGSRNAKRLKSTSMT
jgi:hypothetical protein